MLQTLIGEGVIFLQGVESTKSGPSPEVPTLSRFTEGKPWWGQVGMLVLGPHTGRAQAYTSGRLGALLGSYNQSKKHSHNLAYHYTKEVRSLPARACLMSVYFSYGNFWGLWFGFHQMWTLYLDLLSWICGSGLITIFQEACLLWFRVLLFKWQKGYVRVAIYLLFTTVLFHEILPPLVSDFIFVLQ